MNDQVKPRAARKLLAAVAAAIGSVALAASSAEAGLMIDLRAVSINGAPNPNGPHEAIAGRGDVIQVAIYAVVSGSDNVNDEGFQAIHGSLYSAGSLLIGMFASTAVAREVETPQPPGLSRAAVSGAPRTITVPAAAAA